MRDLIDAVQELGAVVTVYRLSRQYGLRVDSPQGIPRVVLVGPRWVLEAALRAVLLGAELARGPVAGPRRLEEVG